MALVSRFLSPQKIARYSFAAFSPRLTKSFSSQVQLKTPQKQMEQTLLEDSRFLQFVWTHDSRFDIAEWIHQNLEELKALHLQHGAIIFRGFNVQDSSEFNHILDALNLSPPVPYTGGDSPGREKIADRVFEASSIRPEFLLALHNEMSYLPVDRIPDNILFYCELPAREGGRTPIGDSTQIMNNLSPETREAVRNRKIKYGRTFYDKHSPKCISDPMANPWQMAFASESKDDAEASCESVGYTPTWDQNGDMYITTEPIEVTKKHPVTGVECWFNQIPEWDARYQALIGNIDEVTEEQKTKITEGYYDNKTTYAELFDVYCKAIHFEDDSMIPLEIIQEIDAANWNTSVSFEWKFGDFMWLDNHQVSHGRTAYKGSRKVRAALLNNK